MDVKLLELTQSWMWADIEDQETMDGAWALAEESPINILSDMELMGAISRPVEEVYADSIVGAWFGGSREGYCILL